MTAINILGIALIVYFVVWFALVAWIAWIMAEGDRH